MNEIELLSEIGKIEPQCSINCFIGGYKRYFMRTLPKIAKPLKRLDDV